MSSQNGSSPSNNSETYNKNKISTDSIDIDSIDINNDYTRRNIKHKDYDSVEVSYPNPENFKAIFNTKISGWLALILWSILALTVVGHVLSIFIISFSVFNPSIRENPDVLDKTSNVLDDQYSGIYAFLGTLTASVTACYFVSVSGVSQRSDD